jgi:hypothetical protein
MRAVVQGVIRAAIRGQRLSVATAVLLGAVSLAWSDAGEGARTSQDPYCARVPEQYCCHCWQWDGQTNCFGACFVGVVYCEAGSPGYCSPFECLCEF